MANNNHDLPDFELLLASAFFLMSRYAFSQDAQMGVAVAQHMHLLKKHPDCKSELLSKNLARLQHYWERIFGVHFVEDEPLMLPDNSSNEINKYVSKRLH